MSFPLTSGAPDSSLAVAQPGSATMQVQPTSQAVGHPESGPLCLDRNQASLSALNMQASAWESRHEPRRSLCFPFEGNPPETFRPQSPQSGIDISLARVALALENQAHRAASADTALSGLGSQHGKPAQAHAPLAQALAVLANGSAYDTWSCMHMAAVLGDGRTFGALASLLDMKLVSPDIVGMDGTTLLHSMAWHGKQDYARLAMRSLFASMPAQLARCGNLADYIPVDQRIAVLRHAGADMNASMAHFKRAIVDTLAHSGLSEEALALEIEERGVGEDLRLQYLMNKPVVSAQEIREATWRTMTAQASPLMCALYDSLRDAANRPVIEALLEHGANPNLSFYDRDLEAFLHRHRAPHLATIPLHLAARGLGVGIVRALIKAGASLDARGPLGENALHFAANNVSNPEVANTLIRAGADKFVNATMAGELTALHCAAMSNHPGIVMALLEANANVHLRDAAGHSALHFAAAGSNLAVIDALLTHGARILAVTNVQETVLHYAARSSNPQIFSGLMNAGAGQMLFATDESGYLPLHAAAATPGNAATLKTILRTGADGQINARTRGLKTPLQLAEMIENNQEVITCLLEAGAQRA